MHWHFHYCDVIMGAMISQMTSLAIVYSTVYSGADQRKHQSFASLVFVVGICRWPVNSPHKWAVPRKMLPFDDVTIYKGNQSVTRNNGPVMWSFGVVLMFTWTRWWKTIQLPVIWGDMTLWWRHCNVQALAGRPWLLPSPGHHQQYYWLRGMNPSSSSTRNDISHPTVSVLGKYKDVFICFLKKIFNTAKLSSISLGPADNVLLESSADVTRNGSHRFSVQYSALSVLDILLYL